MFDCSRVPGLDGKDFSITYAVPGDTGDSGSIAVLRKGRVWKIDATVDGRLLSTAELEKYVFSLLSQISPCRLYRSRPGFALFS
jgi:carnitine O-acetyltransferase